MKYKLDPGKSAKTGTCCLDVDQYLKSNNMIYFYKYI